MNTKYVESVYNWLSFSVPIKEQTEKIKTTFWDFVCLVCVLILCKVAGTVSIMLCIYK